MDKKQRITEIVLQLKQIKEERELTCQEIYDMVISSGGDLSLATIKRVFAPGSENAGFRFRDTLQPIVKVLCAVEETTTENPPSDTEVDALKNVVLLKETMIEELTAAKEKLEAMLADEASRHADCREMLNMYKEQLRILGDQIARKDRYIDFLLERVKN